MPELEIIPAVLVKTRDELLSQIEKVMPHVKNIQIDIMDGKFVPNKTIGLDELAELPMGVGYEFHWMVADPEHWIEQVPGPHLHMVHIEAISFFERVENAARKMGGSIALAFNPDTPVSHVLPYHLRVQRFMAMAVHPGFSGQKYITSVEGKIRELRAQNKTIDIEVDGGVNTQTIPGLVKAGANKLAAATAIFSAPDVKRAIEELWQVAKAAEKQREEEAWATQ